MAVSVLEINGVSVIAPSSLEVNRYDLDSEEGTGRDQSGMMFRDRKAVKTKVNCEWGPLDMDEVSELLKAMDPVFIDLYYPDPHEGHYRTIECYAGDKVMPIFKIDRYDSAGNPVWKWKGLKVNFIER